MKLAPRLHSAQVWPTNAQAAPELTDPLLSSDAGCRGAASCQPAGSAERREWKSYLKRCSSQGSKQVSRLGILPAASGCSSSSHTAWRTASMPFLSSPVCRALHSLCLLAPLLAQRAPHQRGQLKK